MKCTMSRQGAREANASYVEARLKVEKLFMLPMVCTVHRYAN